MHVGQVLAALGAEHSLPIVGEQPLTDALLELTVFEGARGAGSLAGLVHRVLADQAETAADALHVGLCETGQNVAHHAGVSRGFFAAQRTHDAEQLFFAVADSGRGMLATLEDRGATDDSHALELALTPGISRTAEEGRGIGLADIRQQLCGLGGSLHMVSGSAAIRATRRGVRVTPGDKFFQGTVVQGQVRVSSSPT
jgi:hypothetical protein